MSRYNPYKAYVSIGLAAISIGAVVFKHITSPETEPIPRQTDFQPRPALRPLEVVDPEDTPYTKEELAEIFR